MNTTRSYMIGRKSIHTGDKIEAAKIIAKIKAIFDKEEACVKVICKVCNSTLQYNFKLR